MMFTVLPVCLLVALLGNAWSAAVLERHERQASGWNDPDHPFPESSWSDWTPCTDNCGGGFQGRHKCAYTYQFPPLVGQPPFSVGPTDPPGCPLTVAGCGGQPCSDEFDWQPFEACSVSCGTGFRRRYSGPNCVALNCPLGNNYYQQITCHAQDCTLTEACGVADIVLVLDSSGSVGDFHWFAEKQFAIDLIKGLEIASDETRVSVVTYSTEVELNFGFAEHTTVAALESAIWAIPWMAASTNTADGIRLARQVFEDQARSGVKKIMVVVTDGNSNILNETTIPQADLARQDAILVYAVGIGLNNNDAELLGIGSSPADTFVHYASDFEALGEIVQQVVNGTCDAVVECGAWGGYSTCSASCDGGTQARSRTCTQSIRDVVQSSWTDSESFPCNTGLCPVSVSIVECGNWTDWSQCSVSCGGGYQYRSRQCSESLSGVVQDLWTERDNQTCADSECLREVCGGWIPDGSCSEPCDGGEQKMVRVCKTYQGATLVDTDTVSRYDDCNTHSCHPSGPDCSQCPYEGDYGYLPNPDDICSFYMCRRVGGGGGGYTYSYTAMPCAPGTQWDQTVLTCVHATGGNCRGCVVVVTPEPWVCNLESVSDITKYKDLTTGIVQPCAAGTVFDQAECVCVHGNNPAPSPACTGPLLYFPFDTNFQSVGCETVEAYPTGTGTVSLDWEHMRGMKSAKFDGSGLLLVPFLKNYFNGKNVQAFTVALWFKRTGGSSGIGGLVNNGNCETGSSFDIRVGTGEVVSASLGTDVNTYQSTGTFSVQRWNWIHVAEVYDGSTLKLYIDGEEESSTSLTGPLENSQCSMIIGQMGHDDSSLGFFTGYIDELRVYMRALTVGEIQTLL